MESYLKTVLDILIILLEQFFIFFPHLLNQVPQSLQTQMSTAQKEL